MPRCAPFFLALAAVSLAACVPNWISSRTPRSGSYGIHTPTSKQRPLEPERSDHEIARVVLGEVSMTASGAYADIELDSAQLIRDARYRLNEAMTHSGFIETADPELAEYRVDAVLQKIAWFSGSGREMVGLTSTDGDGSSVADTHGSWVEVEISLRFTDLKNGDARTFDGRGVVSRESGGVIAGAQGPGGAVGGGSTWRMKPVDAQVVPDAFRYATLSAARSAADRLMPAESPSATADAGSLR